MSVPLIKQDNDNSYTPPGPGHQVSREHYITNRPRSPSSRTRHLIQTSVPTPPLRPPYTRIAVHTPHATTLQTHPGTKISLCLISTMLILSRNRPFLSKTNHSPMYLLPWVEPDRRSFDVHDIHPVHSAPETGVKPPSRSYSHSEISTSVGTNDDVGESSHRHSGIRCYQWVTIRHASISFL
ncbi:hypothetical protein BC826DRAFT_64599 [Russula brevipes]|nr:hypothetical protein BC826DRAFT_64599 [Russula brevipes]